MLIQRRDASREKVFWASLPQLPYVSTARGIQTHSNSDTLGHWKSAFYTYGVKRDLTHVFTYLIFKEIAIL